MARPSEHGVCSVWTLGVQKMKPVFATSLCLSMAWLCFSPLFDDVILPSAFACSLGQPEYVRCYTTAVSPRSREYVDSSPSARIESDFLTNSIAGDLEGAPTTHSIIIPEPSSITLTGIGLATVFAYSKLHKRSNWREQNLVTLEFARIRMSVAFEGARIHNFMSGGGDERVRLCNQKGVFSPRTVFNPRSFLATPAP